MCGYDATEKTIDNPYWEPWCVPVMCEADEADEVAEGLLTGDYMAVAVVLDDGGTGAGVHLISWEGRLQLGRAGSDVCMAVAEGADRVYFWQAGEKVWHRTTDTQQE